MKLITLTIMVSIRGQIVLTRFDEYVILHIWVKGKLIIECE